MPSLNINTLFSDRKKCTVPEYAIPQNVKQALCIDAVHADGTFKIEPGSGTAMYDQCYLFEDVNYINKDEQKKTRVLLELIRLFQTVSYYRLPNPYALPAYKVRRDMLRLGRLVEECTYLNAQPEKSREDLMRKREMIRDELRQLRVVKSRLQRAADCSNPETEGNTDARIREYSGQIRALSGELRILDRILADDPAADVYPDPAAAKEKPAGKKEMQGGEVMRAAEKQDAEEKIKQEKKSEHWNIQQANPDL